MSMVINNPSTGTGSSSSSSTNPSSPSSSFSSSAFRPALPVADFLDHCFLCQTKLSPGKDIYMYRGDRAFCSEECRCRRILLDEEAFMRENKNQSHCSSAAHPSSSRNRGAPETEHLVSCDINFNFGQQKQTGNDDEGKKMERW